MEWGIFIAQIALKEISLYMNEQAKNAKALQSLMLTDLQRDIYHERERAAIMEMAVVLQQTNMLDMPGAELIMKAIRRNVL